MLTINQILRSARLMSQVGEIRSGYIDDDAALQRGPDVIHSNLKKKVKVTNGIKFRGKIFQDPVTGEYSFSEKD